MQLNNPIFINQTDADNRYINATGDALNGTLSVTGLTVSGLDTPFILKSPNNYNSVSFNPTSNGNAGILNTNYISVLGLYSVGDQNLSINYGGGGTRSLIFRRGVDRALLDSNGNFGIGSGISSVPSRFYVSGNSILQGDVQISGELLVSGNSVLTGVDLSSYATTANLALTGSTLQTNINNLSGYVNSSSSNILFTTGNQIISGLKTFNTGLSTTYISGVSGISLNILGYSDSISAQTLRNINITAGLGTSTINAGDIILIGGNLSGVSPFILKTGASITIGGAKASTSTADITIKPSIDQNGAAGNIVLEAGASTTYNGKINMFGDININGTADIGTTLSSKNINIYRRGDFFGVPSQRLAISIDNNNVNFQNGMGLQVSGVQVTPALYATSANLASTGSTLQTNINNLSNTYATITNVALTGSTLATNIASTGSTLQTNINNLSNTYATITNVALTGSTLDTKINNVSGYAAPKDIGTTINISSNTISLDLSAFSYFLVNLNSNITTANFNNPKAAPEVTNFVLQLSGDGTIRSVTWPTSLRWPGSAAPTITTGPNKVDTYSIFSYDGGLSYYGFPAGYNS
jgi:hypothetical protein